MRRDATLQDLAARARLDDIALVHDDQLLGALGGETQVVRDEHHGRAELLGHRGEMVEHHALHGHVERRGRLVGDQQLRVGRKADADERALLHTARELVGVLLHALLGVLQAGLLEHLDGALLDLFAPLGEPVGADRLLDLEPDRPDGVEVRHRILGHETDLAAADALHLASADAHELAPVPRHGAARGAAGAREQVDDGVHRGRFARPRLADDRDGLARVDVEGDAVQHLVRLLLRAECDLQVAHAQQRLRALRALVAGCAHRRALAFGSSASRTTSPSRMNPSTVTVSASDG
jgi:hypothetical protein